MKYNEIFFDFVLLLGFFFMGVIFFKPKFMFLSPIFVFYPIKH